MHNNNINILVMLTYLYGGRYKMQKAKNLSFMKKINEHNEIDVKDVHHFRLLGWKLFEQCLLTDSISVVNRVDMRYWDNNSYFMESQNGQKIFVSLLSSKHPSDIVSESAGEEAMENFVECNESLSRQGIDPITPSQFSKKGYF